jgi:hypothetical protein
VDGVSVVGAGCASVDGLVGVVDGVVGVDGAVGVGDGVDGAVGVGDGGVGGGVDGAVSANAVEQSTASRMKLVFMAGSLEENAGGCEVADFGF